MTTGTRYLSNIEKGIEYIQQEHEEYSGYGPDSSKFSRLKDLFVKARERQSQFPQHYQVVTAQSNEFYAFHVIAKKLHNLVAQEKCPKDFQFLRVPQKRHPSDVDGFLKKYPDIKWTKKEVEKEYEKTKKVSTNDAEPEISDQLISASLSLQTCATQDSALHVLVTNSGMHHRSDSGSR